MPPISRSSLRARLTIGVVLLAAVGMLAVTIASLFGLRLYLVNAADNGLAKARTAIQHIQHRPTPHVVGQANLAYLSPNSDYIALLDQHGRIIAQTPAHDLAGQPVPHPALPDPVPHTYATHPTTAQPTGGTGPQFRILRFPAGPHAAVRPQPGAPPHQYATVLLARSLGPGEDALLWLTGTNTLAALTALAAIALLSRSMLRIGLRPLREVAHTATAIADGDLDQRIATPQPHSEIGEVATALNRAFDERQRSEEHLRQFLADASHELRTPLTTIRGWAQLHLHGLAHDPQLLPRAMQRIENEAARMHTMVEDLLLLARLDQGRPLATEPVDLGHLAEDAATAARLLDPHRPITVHVQDPVFALGDEDRLRQVLGNLLNNALHHTPPTTPVSVTARPLPGNTVELTVTDQGPGMTPDTASRIFERFYRADEARTPANGGTGLGLSIVKAITQAHGGTITVHTTPGHGSTFTITLPAAH